jgi:hypothetical protein
MKYNRIVLFYSYLACIGAAYIWFAKTFFGINLPVPAGTFSFLTGTTCLLILINSLIIMRAENEDPPSSDPD